MLSKLIAFTFAVLLVIVAVVVSADGLKIKGVKNPAKKHHSLHRVKSAVLPDYFDWTDHGFNNPVGNQGSCGGGTVAFTMASLISGVNMVTNKQRNSVPLSAAQLIDCMAVESGCCGGMPCNTIQNLISQTGGKIALASKYPWSANNTNGQEGTCRPTSSWTTGAIVTNCIDVANNETAIQEYLYRNGPVAITVDPTALQQYSGGIITGSQCGNFQYYEHMLLLVGWGKRYDPTSGTYLDIWRALNSWGEDFGESGYVIYQRGVNCSGLAGFARSVQVAKNIHHLH